MSESTQRPAAMAVAANMRRLRKQRNWSQQELGEQLGGWSGALVSAAEKMADGGRARVFAIDEVVQIARIFGVAITELLEPIPPCEYCGDKPGRGMKCMACGAKDASFAKEADEE